MLVNLSDVLSEQHRPIEVDIPIEMSVFQTSVGKYEISEKEDVHILIKHVKDRELEISGNARLVIVIPCDRCLEPVRVDMNLEFTKNVDLQASDDEQVDELDEKIILTDIILT